MAVPVKKLPYQIQLTDDIKRQYPGSAIVSILIQQLSNVPSLSGGANKLLSVNNEETAIEFIDAPPGSGSATFTLVTDFPSAPVNNQLVFLTQKQGNNEVGFYQYRVSQWVALFIQSAEFNLPVGTTLPAVATDGSIFFLTDTYLTNRPGVYYRDAGPPAEWMSIAGGAGDSSNLAQSLVALTSRVTTLEADNPVTDISLSGSTLTITKKDATTEDINLPSGGGTPGGATLASTTIYYGVTAVKSDTDSEAAAEANAQTEGSAAFNTQASRTEKSVALQTGGLIPIVFPGPTGWYRPFIAVPTTSINNLRIYSGDNDNETTLWTSIAVTLNAINYTLYVRLSEFEQGETAEWIIKNFS